VRRLKKGSKKYQGKLPLKCFNCGKISHFASKCPHQKKDQNSNDEKKYKYKKYNKKKSLCANNDNSSEDIGSDSSCENKVNDFMIMVMGYFDDEHTRGEMDDEESMVDMEGELISALEEINRLRCKKKKQKQLLKQFKMNGEKHDEKFSLLKVELEEAKKIEDILKQQLSENKERCEVTQTRHPRHVRSHRTFLRSRPEELNGSFISLSRNLHPTGFLRLRSSLLCLSEDRNLRDLASPPVERYTLGSPRPDASVNTDLLFIYWDFGSITTSLYCNFATRDVKPSDFKIPISVAPKHRYDLIAPFATRHLASSQLRASNV
jgi:hypothetical protein